MTSTGTAASAHGAAPVAPVPSAAAPRWCGHLHGMVVHSEIDLGWQRSRPQGPAALAVRVGEARPVPDERPEGDVVAEIYGPDDHFYTAVTTDHGYLVRFYGCCDFAVSADRTEVTVHLDPGVAPEACAPHLAGTLLALLLACSGTLVLHASALSSPAIGDGSVAVALLAGPGGGKTTLAALACAAGSQLVTDDVLSFATLLPLPVVHRGAAEARLRQPATATLGQFLAPPPARRTPDARLAIGIGGLVPDELPLVAGLVPRWTDELTEARLERLGPYEALLAWTRSPRLAGWRDRRALALHFAGAGDLARTVPLFALQLPADRHPTAAMLGSVLEALAGELGHEGERRVVAS